MMNAARLWFLELAWIAWGCVILWVAVTLWWSSTDHNICLSCLPFLCNGRLASQAARCPLPLLTVIPPLFLLPMASSVLSHALPIFIISHSSLRPSTLPLSSQVDSMDNFTHSNTPSREDDPKSHLKSRSRSPSMASDMEPIEVRGPRPVMKSNL